MRYGTAAFWTLGARLGLTLAVMSTSGCTDNGFNPGPSAAHLSLAGGGGQSATVGTALDSALTVLVVDADNHPIAGVLVNFSLSPGGGALTLLATTTDAAGLAATRWTLPTVSGPHTGYAKVAGLDSLPFTATAVADLPFALAILAGDSQTTLVGRQLASPVQVRVSDQFGNPAEGTVVHFSAAAGDGLPAAGSAATNASGVASVAWVLGDSARPMSLTAVVDTLAPVIIHATARFVTPPAMDLALGDDQGCAVIPAGTLRCWGVGRAGLVIRRYRPVDDGAGLAVRAVAPGAYHTCAIGTDSLAYCWGLTSLVGSSAQDPVDPVAVDGGHHFVGISASFTHTCGVEADGAAWCWGWNDHGQLGDGNPGTGQPSPVRVSGTIPFAWISAGFGFTCGLSRTGALYCWGRSDHGQLLLPDTLDVSTPTLAGTSEAFVALEAGEDHACAIAHDLRAYCWGSNAGGQLGGGPLPPAVSLVPVAGNHRFASISAGGEHSCAVELDGTLYCWGSNAHGAVGGGSSDQSSSPVALSPGGFSSVSLGIKASCARMELGSVYCWGDNADGQVGIGVTSLVLTPTAVVSSRPFVSISVGGFHTCAVTATQTPSCWGSNIHGQLGLPASGRPEPLPVTILGGQSVDSLSAGYLHSCAMLPIGAACWGDGEYLGAGLAPGAIRPDPVPVPGGATWRIITAAGERSCGLAADSTGYCWRRFTTPDSIQGGFKFTHLVAGVLNCGVQKTHEILCWNVGNQPSYVTGGPGSGLLTITTDADGACALDASGQVSCWSYNMVPVPLQTSLRFTALSGGESGTTCGLATDGQAYCWGNNSYGQLGDGTTTDRATPTLVSGGHHFTGLSAGESHTCALEASGAAYCWGMNIFGEVGNGASASVPTPTLVF